MGPRLLLEVALGTASGLLMLNLLLNSSALADFRKVPPGLREDA